jgi:hypothetical protein
MERVHVGALIRFNYYGRQKSFSQIMYYGAKYSPITIGEYSELLKEFSDQLLIF